MKIFYILLPQVKTFTLKIYLKINIQNNKNFQHFFMSNFDNL
jgi:hypothetical protein